MTQQATADTPVIDHVSPYAEFQKSEGIPIYGGFAVEDLHTLELGQWARKGGKGAFINLLGTGGTNDAYVAEIEPGGSLEPQRHLYEEMVYVLEGDGATTVWQDDGVRHSFEWKKGSLFAIPLNAWYQHFNGSGGRPVRYLAVTNAPLMINLFHNREFVFNNPFAFRDRFDGRDGYFSANGEMRKVIFGRAYVWDTNFVPDTNAIELQTFKERGAGGSSLFIELAHNTMASHISQFPVGTYKKAHRHGPGAHVIILSGKGFSLLWPEDEQPQRVDWREGSMVVPPDQWFHQHFNSGAEPARYLALRWGSQRYDMMGAMGGEASVGGTDKDVKSGGWQIEYRDEDPAIHQQFEAELGRSGATCRMASMVPACGGVG